MTRKQALEQIHNGYPTLQAILGKHLVGVVKSRGKTRGVFLVNNHLMMLDRDAYREIAGEAKAAGCDVPHAIYCRISTYTGPGMTITQI